MSNLLRIIISIEHPAWVHQFKYLIKKLEKKGHIIKVVAINKDRNLELLDAFNIKYDIISNTSGKNLFEKGLIFLLTTWKILLTSIKFKPDLFFGRASPMMAINSFLFRKNHLVFEDSEPSFFCLFICRLFSTIIITPFLFSRNLGNKHLRVHTYKELFYLHPNHFKPNKNVLKYLKNEKNEKIILIRFVSWTAHHDFGKFGIINKKEIVSILSQFGRVYISSEGMLEKDLQKYLIKTPLERIHDVLFYTDLFFSDSQTMSAEAAILGVPTIRCNSFVGSNDMTNFVELEKKYGLLFNIREPKTAILKAEELMQNPNLKREWRDKRERLLEDKYDITKILVWVIENHPQSFRYIKENPSILA